MEVETTYDNEMNWGTDPQFAKWEYDLQLLIGPLNSWGTNHDSGDVQKMIAAILKVFQDTQEIKNEYPEIYKSSACQQIVHFLNDSLFPNAPSLLSLAEEGQIGEMNSLLGMMNLDGEIFSKTGLYGQLEIFYNLLTSQQFSVA